MNFYGDSFHVTKPGYNYSWTYETAQPNRMVVNAARVNSELKKTYQPWQVKLKDFLTSAPCQLCPTRPYKTKPWPSNCDEINAAAITGAIDGGEVGFMLLNGKRLGNLSAMEAISNQAILGFRASQVAALGETIAGEIIWNAGSRGGVDGNVRKVCRTKSLTDCYIGRFGWVGDRASLEDQVANAAFVEMNMTTSEGYKELYSRDNVPFCHRRVDWLDPDRDARATRVLVFIMRRVGGWSGVHAGRGMGRAGMDVNVPTSRTTSSDASFVGRFRAWSSTFQCVSDDHLEPSRDK